MSDRHVRRTGADYGSAFLQLLPQGPAWPRTVGSTLDRACRGLAQYWGEVDRRAADLLEQESDPRRTIELLPDWERNWGLPDPCYSEPLTIAERQLALIMRMTMQGGQSRQFFIDVAAQIGYTITISEYRTFVVGLDRVGDNRVYGATGAPDPIMRNEWGIPIMDARGDAPVAEGELSGWPYYGLGPHTNRFYWTVHVSATKLVWFRCGSGQCGVDPHLRIGLADDLECLLNRWKPAHTQIIFDYSGLETGDDTTAPVLTGPHGAQLAQSTAVLAVTTDSDDGTLYYVVTTSVTPPTIDEIIGGTAGSQLYAGSQVVTSAGEKTATATGITNGNRYAYFVHVDAASNQSGIAVAPPWAQVDITSPVLSSPHGAQLAQDTATVTVTTDSSDGTLSYVVTASAVLPTAAQIISGTAAAQLYAGNQPVTVAGVKNAVATGITVGPCYSYFVHVDAASNQSAVSASPPWMQADITAPVLTGASTSGVTSSAANCNVTTDSADGTLYVVVTTNAAPPTAAQIVAGHDAGGSAPAGGFAGNEAITSPGAKTIAATGLTPSTAYHPFFTHVDAAGNASLVADGGAFTTSVAPPSYVGSGDVVAGAMHAWGLAAHSAAIAAAAGPAIEVYDTATGAIGPTTIHLKPDGSIDGAAVAALGYACSISQVYDQIGTVHLLQGTHSKRPTLVPNALGTHYGIHFDATKSQELVSTAAIPSTPQPFTISEVVKKLGDDAGGGSIPDIGGQTAIWSIGPNVLQMYSPTGSPTALPVSDGAFHSVSGLYAGAASKGRVDTTDVATGDVGSGVMSGVVHWGSNVYGAGTFSGVTMELAIWAGDKSASFAALNARQKTNWGF